MSNFYQKFLRKHISLAPLGVEQNTENTVYFCTPKGASIIGWSGVDGIHYCFIRGFGDMVFSVNPCNNNLNYVHPIAYSFEDFLGLLLSCGTADALEQAWMWDEEHFNRYIKENLLSKEAKALLLEISNRLLINPVKAPFTYIKNLQDTFDYSKIKYTEDFYDPEMNRDIEPIPPEWKVYYDGNFWGYHGRRHAATEISVDKCFVWAGHSWNIPSIYTCSQGVVIDFCMKIDNKSVADFLNKWEINYESCESIQLTKEQHMLMDLENPTTINFTPKIIINDKTIDMEHSCAIGYNPLDEENRCDLVSKWVVSHYNLDMNTGWMIYRYAFPCHSKCVNNIKSLSIHMEQNMAHIPVARFNVNKIGDSIKFINPKTKETHNLTIIDYENQVLPKDFVNDETMDYPTCFKSMNYTIAPPIDSSELSVYDCSKGDSPRKKIASKDKDRLKDDNLPTSQNDMAVCIIGGATGITAISLSQQDDIHTACSSIYFEPVDNVEWMVILHEKQFDDIDITLIKA